MLAVTNSLSIGFRAIASVEIIAEALLRTGEMQPYNLPRPQGRGIPCSQNVFLVNDRSCSMREKKWL